MKAEIKVSGKLDGGRMAAAAAVPVQKNVRNAGNFIRRTEYAAVAQPAPHIKLGKGSRLYTGSSVAGDPPLKKSGRLAKSVGFDLEKRAATLEMTGRIGVDTRGLELGTTGRLGRIAPRPSLRAVVLANLAAVGRILEGAPAPQSGDTGRAARRKPQKDKVQYQGKKRSRVTYGAGQTQRRS